MKNFEEFINEAVNYKDRSGKPFKIKGINFVYTDGGRFYGTSLYDVAQTSNVGKRSKIGFDETQKLLTSLGVKEKLPGDYGTARLDRICKELKKKGIVCDHADIMDVS